MTILVSSLVLAAVALFGLYGWSKGYSVANAVSVIFSADPPPDSNPVVEKITGSRISWNGDIQNKNLSESSGLASSNRYDDLLWSMNDSGNASEIFAMTGTGADLGSWSISTETITDWEAMSSFVKDDEAYLLIADVGDNFRWRSRLSLVIVKEPDPADITEAELAIEWKVEFSYPEGVFRDCEAVAVDIGNERVILITKRVYPPEVYELPLLSKEFVIAKKIAELPYLPKATFSDIEEEPGVGQYRRMVTGMDIRDHQLLLTTYQDVYLFDLRRLEAPPLMVPMPLVGQRESISFDRNTSATAYVTRERSGGTGVADVFKIELPEFFGRRLEAEQDDL
ncbi:hypothetical protein OAL14_04850 [Gammaproteobacteria bacterium]|nr:hypothetical protein [Gammaproteobacteria bacterium]